MRRLREASSFNLMELVFLRTAANKTSVLLIRLILLFPASAVSYQNVTLDFETMLKPLNLNYLQRLSNSYFLVKIMKIYKLNGAIIFKTR